MAKNHVLLGLVAVSWTALGCTAPADRGDADDDEDIGTSEAALSTTGGYRNHAYNWGGQGHHDVCATLKNGAAQLRYPSGGDTGIALTNDMLKYDPAIADLGGGLFRSATHAVICADGQVRLDARELLGPPNARLVFHRGGWGFVGGDPLAAARFGHLLMSDLAGAVQPAKSGAEGHGKLGNGDACPEFTATHYRIVVRSIPDDMWYLKSSGEAPATTYTIYGDSGADLGTPEERALGIHFTMLTWSWINVSGGGVARALLKDRQRFRRCAHVPMIRLASVDAATMNKNGWVRAVYGGTPVDGKWLYGWVVESHRHLSDAPVKHLAPVH